jgi:phenylalanyl-tRNA synthetase beta chain
MKISYNTLKKYIPNIKSAEDVAQDLIMHTAEVEEIIYEGENLKDVYIGEILEVEKHPDSEKLNVCQVEVKGEKTQIVCGAANVKP